MTESSKFRRFTGRGFLRFKRRGKSSSREALRSTWNKPQRICSDRPIAVKVTEKDGLNFSSWKLTNLKFGNAELPREWDYRVELRELSYRNWTREKLQQMNRNWATELENPERNWNEPEEKRRGKERNPSERGKLTRESENCSRAHSHSSAGETAYLGACHVF